MKAKILGLIAAALLAGPFTAGAVPAIDVGVNSDTKFSGTFSFVGCSDALETVLSSGGLLPANNLDVGLSGFRDCDNEAGGGLRLLFATDAPGLDGVNANPIFQCPATDDGACIPPSNFALSGNYGNPSSTEIGRVWWQFTGLTDTGGGVSGTFSGAFCFSASADGCTSGTAPEPGTLALLGLGLAGLAASRRRKR